MNNKLYIEKYCMCMLLIMVSMKSRGYLMIYPGVNNVYSSLECGLSNNINKRC